MYQLRIVRRDGSVVSSGAIIDHELADRLARQCRRDEAVAEVIVVPLPANHLLPENAHGCSGCGDRAA